MSGIWAHRAGEAADNGHMSVTPLLEAWLGPYLGGGDAGRARYVNHLPATEALAATSVDPGCDIGIFDGLPGVAMLAEAALAVDPAATMSGLLIDSDRHDARLHIDRIYMAGDLAVEEVLRGLATVIPEGANLEPASVERHGDRWLAWWD